VTTLAPPGDASATLAYALERLFIDQDRDWVTDAIAPVLAWVPGKSKSKSMQPFRFAVERVFAGAATDAFIDLTWDLLELERLVPGLRDHTRRLREGRTVQREHVTQLAAYGLTMVALSALMPGRRVKAMNLGSAPDILFDVTPGALRGVESAGRTTGGRAALITVRDGVAAKEGRPAQQGKAAQLRARSDIAEVHLSLWCSDPRRSIMEQVKP
jgi:hypothetical protein